MSKLTQVTPKTVAKIPTPGNDATTLGANSVATTNLQDLSVTTPKIADSAITPEKLSSDSIDAILKYYKNYAINGDMSISQRGNSFAGVSTTGTYTLDRYRYGSGGAAAVFTVTRDQSSVPTFAQVQAATGQGYIYVNTMNFTVTTADASMAAGDSYFIEQLIEGQHFVNLAQEDFTISFWVRSSVTGTYCVAVRNAGLDRSFVAEYTISVANTWEYKSVVITASPAAGTWNYTSSTGARVSWTLANGASTQTTPGVWQTGNFVGTANQVNSVGTIGNSFRLTGIMINKGTFPVPFRLFSGGDVNAEQRVCERYYEKSNPIGTDPNTQVGEDQWRSSVYTDGTRVYTTLVEFKTEKRASPTTRIWSAVGATLGSATFRISGSTETVACTTVSGAKRFSASSNNNLLSAAFNNTNASAYGMAFSWDADAELN